MNLERGFAIDLTVFSTKVQFKMDLLGCAMRKTMRRSLIVFVLMGLVSTWTGWNDEMKNVVCNSNKKGGLFRRLLIAGEGFEPPTFGL
jgi:hypothetical protein